MNQGRKNRERDNIPKENINRIKIIEKGRKIDGDRFYSLLASLGRSPREPVQCMLCKVPASIFARPSAVHSRRERPASSSQNADKLSASDALSLRYLYLLRQRPTHQYTLVPNAISTPREYIPWHKCT